jgi:hypothetical protein
MSLVKTVAFLSPAMALLVWDLCRWGPEIQYAFSLAQPSPFILLQESRYLDSQSVIHLPDQENDYQENRGPKEDVSSLWVLVDQAFIKEFTNYDGDIKKDIEEGNCNYRTSCSREVLAVTQNVLPGIVGFKSPKLRSTCRPRLDNDYRLETNIVYDGVEPHERMLYPSPFNLLYNYCKLHLNVLYPIVIDLFHSNTVTKVVHPS